MIATRDADEIVSILKKGDFDSLIGRIEDVFWEVKGSPYQLSGSELQRQELAKDVSALANVGGGIILIGFRTIKDAVSAVEYIDACRPFDLNSIDTDQYRKVLQDWIYPPIHSIEISCYPAPLVPGKGVAAIVVPASATENKPHVVTRSVEADGKVRGTLIGYYERVQATTPPSSAETIRGHLRDGMRFAEISQHLKTIEAFLGNTAQPTAQTQPAINDTELRERIAQAENAVERKLRPNIILAAASTTQCSFPELFQSQSTDLVRFLQKPPLLRQDGFAITLKGSFQSEIIQGRLRRVVARGHKLLDVWKDGALIAVGPGDDDMLCWFMRSQTAVRKPGLPIRNFVLGEVTLNFINLAVVAFKHAKPTPQGLEFLLVLNNMTEEGVPCTLSAARDNRPFPVGFGETKNAPSEIISSAFTTQFESIDIGVVAYHLLGELYVQFGFNYDDMPYVQHDPDKNRITPTSLFGEPWR